MYAKVNKEISLFISLRIQNSYTILDVLEHNHDKINQT